MNIEDLADFPALRQLEKALWKEGKARGAAIFIGSGFSRNAELIHERSLLPPVWSDLIAAMESRIETRGDRYRDPLRTAEEFVAVLGRPALDGLIRELVADEQWLPGALHQELVQLPWADIITTNWDTLLERAAATTLGQTYETVRCLEDIATTQSPRVVKLHGSLPSGPFILSEEDYRTYPQKYAPFVNLVQQVLLENELCLLGFSGDDPNFLQWSGWVRDQLGASARRIYLVGALNLRTAQRRLLEQRNVAPIDLGPLVAEMEPSRRHKAATQIFLDRLHASRPKPLWDWGSRPVESTWSYNDPATKVAASFAELATAWASARYSYPGWAVCPSPQRHYLEDSIRVLQRRDALAAMSRHDRTHICFEAAWRLDTALLPINDWLATLEACVEDQSSWSDPTQRDFVLMLLLRNAREDRDSISFERWAAEIERRAASNPHAKPCVIYERCLWARDGLDFSDLEKLVPRLEGNDPLWGLRQAALYCYLGDFNSARAKVDQVVAETRSLHLRDRNSIWALSRLAWAHFCAATLRKWNERPAAEEELTPVKLRLHEAKCEPWDTIAELEDQIEESRRKDQEASRGVEARFEPGSYHDHRSSIRIGRSPGLVNYTIDRLSDSVGIPLRTESALILTRQVQDAEPLTVYEHDASYLRLLRIVQTDAPAVLDRNFGRVQIARLSKERLQLLKQRLFGALEYALKQSAKRNGWLDQFWSTRVRIYTELLSRLLVRSEPAEALEWFRRGLSFGRDPRWHYKELFEPLGHLVQRAIASVPVKGRVALLEPTMEFPLPDEISLPEPFLSDWPDSSEWLSTSVIATADVGGAVRERIASLLQITRDGRVEARKRAVSWLMKLQRAGVLRTDESEQFGDALWSRRPTDVSLPCDTNLRPHMFLLLPAPNREEAHMVFKSIQQEKPTAAYIISIAGATHAQSDGTHYEIFDHSEAITALEKIVNWCPEPVPTLDLGQVDAENKRGVRSLGSAITDGILTLLTPGELPLDLAERIFAREKDALPVVQAYPEIVRLIPHEHDRAVTGIIRAMVARDGTAAWAGFNALYRWLLGSKSGLMSPVPTRLVDETISVVETRREPGLPHALNLAGHLLNHSLLSASDKKRLADALGILYVESAYENGDYGGPLRETTWTLTRATAAQLAGALCKSGAVHPDLDIWLKNAPSDPLPEVRFAIGSPFE